MKHAPVKLVTRIVIVSAVQDAIIADKYWTSIVSVQTGIPYSIEVPTTGRFRHTIDSRTG
jgi:hypothetical protein